MLPVLIGSHPASPWLQECVDSVKATTDRDIVVHTAGGFEPAALQTGCDLFDRFLFLHDSVKILSSTFWEHVDGVTGGAWLSGWPPMFMGVHDRAQIHPHLPSGRVSKAESIILEADLPHKLNYSTIWPNVTDRTALRLERKHDRNNLVLGVEDVWEKWKGSWV